MTIPLSNKSEHCKLYCFLSLINSLVEVMSATKIDCRAYRLDLGFRGYSIPVYWFGQQLCLGQDCLEKEG